MARGETGLAIGEVARRGGVAPSTLRYWEGLGPLDAPERVGGKRPYDARTLRRIFLERARQDR